MGTLRGEDRRAVEEAAAWFTRLKQPSVSEATIEQFFEWRRAPEHGAAYAEVEARWRQADRVRNDPELVRLTEAALRQPSLWQWLAQIVRRRMLPLGFAAIALAGAVVLTVSLLRPQTYETGVGAQQVVRLEDGSVLRLNTDSKVEVRFGAGERRLVLRRGQGFFEVAHDAARPFIVEAGDARVRAVGTKFDVLRADHATRVTLVEGQVQVGRSSQPRRWTLRPNQQITLDGVPPAPETTDAAEATSWTTGRLRFRETPLAEAVAEVNRYSRTKIVLDAEQAAAVRVSGVFDAGDTAAFVSAVTELFALQAVTRPGRIELRPRAAATAD